MAPEGSAPLAWQALRQSVLGRRGLVKTASVWLPLAVLASALEPDALGGSVATCLLAFVAVACWGQASILANDIADRDEDLAAGKERWIAHLSLPAGGLVVTALVGAGALALVLPGAPAGTLVAYGVAVALGLLYSIRPIRFKERGLLGPLAYSLSGALACVAVPWAWLGSGPLVLAVLGPAVLLDKRVNLQFGQVEQFEADRAQASGTYAVRVGLGRARRTLRWEAALASAAMVAVVAFVAVGVPSARVGVVAASAGVVIGAVAFARLAGRGGELHSPLVGELPGFYLGLTFAVFRILPPLLFARLAGSEPLMWIPGGMAALSAALESAYLARYSSR
jgi:4-hydroxybenzoate polyprenyltransferase